MYCSPNFFLGLQHRPSKGVFQGYGKLLATSTSRTNLTKTQQNFPDTLPQYQIPIYLKLTPPWMLHTGNSKILDCGVI